MEAPNTKDDRCTLITFSRSHEPNVRASTTQEQTSVRPSFVQETQCSEHHDIQNGALFKNVHTVNRNIYLKQTTIKSYVADSLRSNVKFMSCSMMGLVPWLWNGQSPKLILCVWCLDVWLGKSHKYYFASVVFMLGWTSLTAIILCLMSWCCDGQVPQILCYVWCLDVGMGMSHSYYSMSGASMLEWAHSKANILSVAPPCWDRNSPKRI